MNELDKSERVVMRMGGRDLKGRWEQLFVYWRHKKEVRNRTCSKEKLERSQPCAPGLHGLPAYLSLHASVPYLLATPCSLCDLNIESSLASEHEVYVSVPVESSLASEHEVCVSVPVESSPSEFSALDGKLWAGASPGISSDLLPRV
ncbi:hypothetical protein RRG08_024273 [Elysia crispata]|uniref:Uncharacterized protein n=1 Tax=Elysia crispata TaxID=231223 RepID=A0AAE0Z348_9GAST|nr:hypothetical protein RRG08_024273 [Elysia crispata]